MKEERIETIKNIAGLVLTTGLALTTQGSSGLVIGVLNGIAGNLASSYVEKASYAKIKNLIEQPHPSTLNHDLQKLIVISVEWAIKNIEILYRDKIGSDKEQKVELSAFIKELLTEVKVLNDLLSVNEEKSFYKIIENPQNGNSIFKTLDINVSDFPTISEHNPFPQFFKEQFQPNLQLCFGELLKDKRNQSALIAYQREIYQSLESGIDNVIAQNNLILQKIDNKKEVEQETQSLNKVKTLIKRRNKNVPDPIFIQTLNDKLKTITEQNKVILKQNTEVLETVRQVRGITKGISIDLKQNWLEKNKVYVLSGAGIVFLVIFGLVYYLNSQPFNMVVHVEKNSGFDIHQDYPPLNKEAIIRFYFPTETKEKEVTFSNEIIVNNIPFSLKGSTINAELIDPYWKLSSDSISLLPKNVAIQIEPNDELSKVSGRVLSRDGQLKINNARIIVDKQQFFTDDLGKFLISIPVSDRKPTYLLRIEKEGFSASEILYYPGSDKEIRLNKL